MTTNTTSNIKDIVINGVSARALKALEAQVTAFREGAPVFMDESIVQGTALVDAIAQAIEEGGAGLEVLIAEALDVFKAVFDISNVAGVPHNLPHGSRQALSNMLDELDDDEMSEGFYELSALLEDMEFESYCLNDGEYNT